MLRTKKDVDAHVRDIFNKVITEKEKGLRCLSIARAYTGIREFDMAKRYLEMYIKASPNPANLADAYKLMGDILHDTGEDEEALSNYKKSYELNKSRVALNRVCDLLHFGHGKDETNETKKMWFDLQKTAASSGFPSFAEGRGSGTQELGSFLSSPLSVPSPAAASPYRAESRTKLYLNGGVSNGGLNRTPGLPTPPKPQNKVYPSPDRMDVQMKYLERRLDDVLSQIMEQNNKLIDQNTKLITSVAVLGGEVKDLRDSVSSLQSPTPTPTPLQPTDPALLSTPPTSKNPETPKPSTQLFQSKPVPDPQPIPTTSFFPRSTLSFIPTQTLGSLKPAETVAKPTPAVSETPSPFAAFTFSATAASGSGIPNLANPNKTSTFQFGGSGGSNDFFKKMSTDSPTLFSGKPKEATQPVPTDQTDNGVVEEFVPTAEFAPVIPLPPLVEVKKGDEDYNTVFEVRAKLLRWEGTTSEWKERGVGNIKLLQHKIEKRKVRILMWREQIHKIACNHSIVKGMTVGLFQKNPKTLMWTAIDFTEGQEGKDEIFVCKFGKEEQCAEFRRHFEDLEKQVEDGPADGESENPKAEDSPVSGSISQVNNNQKPLSELFKKPEGAWTCSGCYMDNSKTTVKCPSCGTFKPGSEPDQSAQPTLPLFSTPIFGSSTSAPAFGFSFGTPTTPHKDLGKDPVVKLAVTETPSPFSAFSFSATTAAKGPGFGDLATQNKSSPFQFAGSGGSNDFFKKLSTESPTLFGGKPKEAPQPAHSDQGDDGVVEDFVPTAEFAPVIPLPPLVEVKKGDEDYNTVFEVRAKLLRWEGTTSEWKERGLGNIRLLQHKIEKRKARILMWREQIHKIACNHSILKGMTVGLFQNNPKTLMWTAIDFTEGQEGKNEIFVCKFGKEEQCAQFKRHFEELERQVEEEPAEGESESPKAEEPPVSGSVSQVNNNQKPLSELFKKPEGAWTCSGCYMDNSKTTVKCPSCGTFKPGSEPEQSVQPTLPLFSAPIFGSSTSAPTFGFSFGTPAPPHNDLSKDPVNPSVSETPSPFAAFSFSATAAAQGPGFGDLASQNKSSNFQFAGSDGSADFFKKLSTESPTIFGGKPKEVSQSGDKDQTTDGIVEDFVPTAEFAPVFPLPPLVEVKKGDEDYNTVFEVRAKLLRWEGTTSEWKERGLGNIRLLQHKLEKRKVRILMWREQIHKIACNHSILKGMTVGLFQNNPKTLMWTAIDFTEGQEGKNEIFVCKFGKEEQCAEFRRHFEDLERQVEDVPALAESESPKAEDSTVSGSISQVNNNQKPLSELFKKPEGAWACSGCYMDNSKTTVKCPSCGTFKPGSEPDQSAQPTLPLFSAPIFGSSTSTPTFGFSFGTPATPQNDLGKDPVKETPSPFSAFSFAATPAAQGPGFGDLASQNKSSNFQFAGSDGSADFFKKLSTESPSIFGGKPKEASQSVDNDPADDGVVEEFEPTVEFKPVVPLPPLVEAKKGDEDDNIVFEVRAKLLRWEGTTSEWKERGVGNIKLLQNKGDKRKARIVMWREQIHKIACNHSIVKGMTIGFFQNNPKTLVWTAIDFAEGQGNNEIFVCRFGKEESCAEFRREFENLVKVVESDDEESGCPGCIGCDPDAFDFGRLEGRVVPTYPDSVLTPAEYRDSLLTSPTKHVPAESAVPLPSSLLPSAPFTFTLPMAQLQPNPPPFTSQPHQGDEDEDDEDYEDEEEEEPPMFEGVAQLSVRYPGSPEYLELGDGVISLIYDNELYCSRFHFIGNNEQEISHVIAADTHLLSIGDLTFAWSGLSESDDAKYTKLELQGTFSESSHYDMFLDRFSDSQEVAAQAGITEEYLLEEEQQ